MMPGENGLAIWGLAKCLDTGKTRPPPPAPSHPMCAFGVCVCGGGGGGQLSSLTPLCGHPVHLPGERVRNHISHLLLPGLHFLSSLKLLDAKDCFPLWI